MLASPRRASPRLALNATCHVHILLCHAMLLEHLVVQLPLFLLPPVAELCNSFLLQGRLCADEPGQFRQRLSMHLPVNGVRNPAQLLSVESPDAVMPQVINILRGSVFHNLFTYHLQQVSLELAFATHSFVSQSTSEHERVDFTHVVELS